MHLFISELDPDDLDADVAAVKVFNKNREILILGHDHSIRICQLVPEIKEALSISSPVPHEQVGFDISLCMLSLHSLTSLTWPLRGFHEQNVMLKSFTSYILLVHTVDFYIHSKIFAVILSVC